MTKLTKLTKLNEKLALLDNLLSETIVGMETANWLTVRDYSNVLQGWRQTLDMMRHSVNRLEQWEKDAE